MYKQQKVSVVIPTYNEAESIKGVIDDLFATALVDAVIAVDNNALGDTAEQIKKTKAIYIKESKNQGYGHAIMRGLKEATGDLIIITEADGTFQSKDVEKLLSYSDEFDAVLGTRTSPAVIWSGAFMPFFVRFGNYFWAKLIEVLFNATVLTDVGCTYKLITRSALDKVIDLFPLSKGDGTFNPEFMIWLLLRKVEMIEIPVIYKERTGKSMYTGSTWRAAKLGFKMLPIIFKYFFTKP